MPFKSLKEKINTLASGEILGETEEEREEREKKERSEKSNKRNREQSAPIPKAKKTREPKKAREKKSPVESFFKRKPTLESEEDIKSISIPKEEKKEKIKLIDSVDGYEDVLAILGIKEDLKMGLDFESGDLDYIEFSQTTPLGFDFDEVTDFISRMKYILNKYENAVKQRDKEIVILASEIKKVEQRMIEQNQAKEMEKMMGGMTEEERLIEENMDLKVELNKLKAQKANANGVDNKVVEELQNQIKALRAENQILTSRMMNENKNVDLPAQPKGLPSIEEKKESQKDLPPMNLGTLPEISAKDMSDIIDVEEGEDFLNTLMKMGKPKKVDKLESMLDDLGGDY